MKLIKHALSFIWISYLMHEMKGMASLKVLYGQKHCLNISKHLAKGN